MGKDRPGTQGQEAPSVTARALLAGSSTFVRVRSAAAFHIESIFILRLGRRVAPKLLEFQTLENKIV